MSTQLRGTRRALHPLSGTGRRLDDGDSHKIRRPPKEDKRGKRTAGGERNLIGGYTCDERQQRYRHGTGSPEPLQKYDVV